MLKLLIFTLTTALGLGFLLYPNASRWLSQRHSNNEIIQHTQQITALNAKAQDRLITEAFYYNQRLQQNTLDDLGHQAARYDLDYQQQLRVPGTNVIGRVTVERLGIDLPIFRGTEDLVLFQGVGHLFGTHLPVGGESTHAVLTTHSGINTAELFSPLLNAVIGDQIIITIGTYRLVYAVEAIFEVYPHQIEYVGVQAGRDILTLITCTPIGINTYRLLVQAQRTSSALLAETGTQYPLEPQLGFPWFIVWFLAGVTGTGLVGNELFIDPKTKQENIMSNSTKCTRRNGCISICVRKPIK